jgi:hypothetical protein
MAAAAAEAAALRCVPLSASPHISYFPAFVSADECDALLALAHSRPDAWCDAGGGSGGGAAAPAEYTFQFLRPLDRHFQAAVRAVEARIAAATGVPCHNGEDPLKLSRHGAPAPLVRHEGGSTAEAEAAAPPLLNVHHDANAARPRRVATVVMYLADVAAGGGTVFPCADAGAAPADAEAPAAEKRDLNAEALRAGQPAALAAALGALHAHGTYLLPVQPGGAYSSESVEGKALAGAHATCARLAAAQAASGAPWVRGADGGLLVAPRRGAAVIFWSVSGRGDAIDGRDAPAPPYGPPLRGAAWHGAAAVHSGVKLAAQKFKEAPDAADAWIPDV